MDINEIRKQLEAERSQHSKFSQGLQLVLFLAMFTGLFLLGCKLFDSFWLRALSLLLAYFISSMLLFLVVKPLFDKIESRKRSQRKK